MQFLRLLVTLLEWIETAQEFISFLQEPIGFTALSVLLSYSVCQVFGYDSLSAKLLPCTIAFSAFSLTSAPKS